MPLRMSSTLQDDIVNSLVEALASEAGSGGHGCLRIYTGRQPNTPNAAASGTLLAEITGICWGYTSQSIYAHSAVVTVNKNASGHGEIASMGGNIYGGLKAGCQIVITGTTGNNGTYEVLSVVGDNTINTVEVIAGLDNYEMALAIDPRELNTACLMSDTGYAATAVASGTAGWGRLFSSEDLDDFIIDGDVGLSEDCVFTLNSLSVVQNEQITLTDARIDVYEEPPPDS